MNDLENILTQHAKRYPLMQPQDAVKLIYQSEFGGGHLIDDITSCKNRLKQEYESAPSKELPLYENISENIVRINLQAAKKISITPDAIFKLFLASTKNISGSISSFKDKLPCLKKLTMQGIFSFSSDELNEYIADYIAKCCPILSHSEIYRQNYSPSYRIFENKYINLLPVVERIEELYNKKERIIIAIDGKAASGKSTAADFLSSIYPDELSVIHMDDYFLPYELRTAARYSEPGGNIHYERFKDEVIAHLNSSTLSYKKFNCSNGCYSEDVLIKLPKIMLIEGSYSLHPYFNDYYDISVFSDIPKDTQLDRILLRNGEALSKMFKEKWIPLEEKYFAAYRIKDKCDIII